MKKSIISVVACVFAAITMNGQVIFQSDFETWENGYPVGWGGSQNTLPASNIGQVEGYNGGIACQISNQGSSLLNFSSLPMTMEEGAVYTLKFYTYHLGLPNEYAQLALYSYEMDSLINIVISNNGFYWEKTPLENGWVENNIRITWANPTTTAELLLYFWNIWMSDNAAIDDFTLTKISAAQRLDLNNIAALFHSDGTLFQNGSNAGFFAPKDGSATSIFAGHIWLGGLGTGEILHLAAQCFGQDGDDYFAGPVATNYDEEYMQRYNRVWKVSKADIDYHLAHYWESDYQMPEAIANWAGNGNEANGEAHNLAPYVDVNSNDIYDPQNGDYPQIRGDQAVFFIFNDAAGEHTESHSPNAIGAEVHAMAFAYDLNATQSTLNTEVLPNTIFISYSVINRSSNDYHNFYFGSWTDIDLGYSGDDFVGYDSVRNMFYGYNGKAVDGPGAGAYFGNPPAQGVMFLNANADKFLYYNNANGTINGEPTDAIHYYNYMRGVWKNGQPMLYGGDGCNTGTTATPANYMYDGYPELGEGWTESSVGNSPGDRRGVMSFKLDYLFAGEAFCIDLAYPFAWDSAGANELTSLALLRQRADAIQAFYNTLAFGCNFSDPVGLNDIKESSVNAVVYPNPTTGSFTLALSSPVSNGSLELFSAIGGKVMASRISSTMQTLHADVPSGLYFYVVKEGSKIIARGKIVVQ
ncbi:MAG: T9SS type A sorting domain-containing protein [Bacteroidales bacterium]|jgi:hypothetical protein|nr:T9SS type A sorting domain-containing protein [Bacteroidales bacterium]